MKGVKPAYKRAVQLRSVFLQGMSELLQLYFVEKLLVFILQFQWRDGGMPESKVVIKVLPNQKRFSYTTPAVNGQKLRRGFF